MNTMHKLAIVIPAYKSEYLSDTMNSIRDQTCKDFTLYVCDDGSPENLSEIVSAYADVIEIVYTRFNENMGSKDLVGHWERSIALTQGEDWIWLFSDDDVMEPRCVESFYKTLNEGATGDLFHFDINVIDGDGLIMKRCTSYENVMKVNRFFTERVRYNINSSVVEYIFSRAIYQKEGGFKKYDLAWCSDDATWIKFGLKSSIVTIPDARVYWRFSGSNISSNLKQKSVVIRKLMSNVAHVKWVREYFNVHGITEDTSYFEKFKWIISVVILSQGLSLRERYRLGMNVLVKLDYLGIAPLALGYMMYWDMRRLIATRS